MFGDRDDDWGGEEDLGSDIDMEELAGRAKELKTVDMEDDIEVVPSGAGTQKATVSLPKPESDSESTTEPDSEEENASSTSEEAAPPSASTPAPVMTTATTVSGPPKLKDLFAPREEEGLYRIATKQMLRSLTTCLLQLASRFSAT